MMNFNPRIADVVVNVSTQQYGRGPVGMNSRIHSLKMLSYKSQICVSNILSDTHFITFFLLINIRMSPVKFV
jgi:hypothetical protein